MTSLAAPTNNEAAAPPLASLLSESFKYNQTVEIRLGLELTIQTVSRQELVQRVNRKQIAEGQDITGLKLWDFGLEFAKYLSRYPLFFSGKNILELGSGCGTLSLSLAATAKEASLFTITDAAEDALGLIRANVERNRAVLGDANVSVEECLWTTEEKEDKEDKETFVESTSGKMKVAYDIVLGTDLLYHMTTVESLFATALRSLCTDKKGGGVFLLGGMSRYYGTIASIRTSCEELHLAITFVSLKKMEIQYCDGMFLAIIARDESSFVPVLEGLNLEMDDSVNDDFEEENDDY